MHDAAIVHLLSVGSCPGVAAGLALLAAAAVCHCIVLCSLVLWSWRHSILGAEAKSSDPLHLLAGALPAALPDPDSLDALSGMSAAASSVQNHSWRTPAQQQYAEWAVYAGGSLQGASQQQGASSCHAWLFAEAARVASPHGSAATVLCWSLKCNTRWSHGLSSHAAAVRRDAERVACWLLVMYTNIHCGHVQALCKHSTMLQQYLAVLQSCLESHSLQLTRMQDAVLQLSVSASEDRTCHTLRMSK